jgi:hypothetical protein
VHGHVRLPAKQPFRYIHFDLDSHRLVFGSVCLAGHPESQVYRAQRLKGDALGTDGMSTINLNPGTNLVGAPQSVAGKFGLGVGLNGIDDYLEVPDSPSLDITGAITVVA